VELVEEFGWENQYNNYKDFISAEEAFLSAIKIDPQFDRAWINLGCLIGDGYYSEATEKIIDRIVKSDSNNIWAKALSGMLSLEKSNEFNKAQDIFRNIIQLNPEFTMAWGLLIRLHHKRGNILQQWGKELSDAKMVINNTPQYMYPEIVDFIIDASAGGSAEGAMALLTESTIATKLEPLITGLRIFLGEERPLIAQEVFEIGKDVADRIRTKQAELANSPVTE
jgi:tetratricopeptide (TPR) repeat protein